MKVVDNSGQGNCMYYAYSISLMYFLRAKNDRKTTEGVFDKLNLSEPQKISLRKLLSEDSSKPFNESKIIKVIEPILGQATRIAAGEFTVKEFLSDPKASPVFTATNYGMEYYVLRALQANSSSLGHLIDNNFSNRDYTLSEIYRVGGIKAGLESYAETHLFEIIHSFNEIWEEKHAHKDLSLKDEQFFRAQVLDTVIRDATVKFFEQKDGQYINDYKKHLQKNYVWGSEETLLTLHRGVIGERFERNESDRIDTVRDTEITLHIHKNGSSPSFQSSTPDMILNNSHNVHWTSKIPDRIYNPTPVVIVKGKSHQSEEEPAKPLPIKASAPKNTKTDSTSQASVIEPKSPPSLIEPFAVSSEKERGEKDDVSERVINQQKVYKVLDDLRVARDGIPMSHQEYEKATSLIQKLEDDVVIIMNPKATIEEKEKATHRVIENMAQAAPELGQYKSFKHSMIQFISMLLDLIPSFLGGNIVRSGLATLGLYQHDNRTEVAKSIQSVSNQLLDTVKQIDSVGDIEEQQILSSDSTKP